MCSSFNITMMSQTDVQLFIFIFPRGWYGYKYVRQIESTVSVQWGQKNPNPRANHSIRKLGLPSFPLNGGPEGWDFSGTTEHQ